MYTIWNQCKNVERSSNIKLSDDDIFFKLWFNYTYRSWKSLWTMMKVATCCRSSPRTCKIAQLSSSRSFRGTITMWDAQWSVCVKFNNAMHVYHVCVQFKNAQFFVLLRWADVPYFIGLSPFIIEIPVIHLSS